MQLDTNDSMGLLNHVSRQGRTISVMICPSETEMDVSPDDVE